MGEEEETNKVTVHKRPTRHHVKRRSSGRVHVAKIAPMARANSAAHTDSEAELATDQERPTMRRSQSQRSLHRMSFDRKAFTSLTTTRRKSNASVKLEEPPKTTVYPPTSNPASLSDRVIAAPVEQTFNATAHNLVIPKKAVYPKIATPLKPEIPSKKPLLRSQFICVREDPITATKRNNLSRTQQKLMLQRQQSQLEDESSPMHPRNMQKINKELETLGRHYRSVKNFHDPMKDSLIRCLERLNMKPISNNPAVTRIQLGANQHSISTSVVPTMYVPHLEQRQIAHRHHRLKAIALSRTTNNQSLHENNSVDKNQSILGTTTAFLGRMFNN
ncbi:hypothetical protein BDF21DRAFT_348746 [Thamnidium elegans]|nr:hypothetical protein BDF21DRAFT_348746 [Thamnidium elegans]